MPKSKPPYPIEFRRRIIELHRSGRTMASLANPFEVSENSIRIWSKQVDLDEGRRTDGLTSDERTEFQQLRREVRHLREERETPKKSRRLDCAGVHGRPAEAFRFVSANQAACPMAMMCEALCGSRPAATARGASVRRLRGRRRTRG
jgi:transposase